MSTQAPIRLLANKIALITGATTGIGRAIALAYISHGARVAVNHLDNEAGHAQFASLREEVAGKLGESEGVDEALMNVPGDVGVHEEARGCVEETVRRWGRLDVFVSNGMYEMFWGEGVSIADMRLAAGICEFSEFLE